jgi:hypothetical protein
MLNFFPCVTLTKGDTAAWPRASRAKVRAHWTGFPAAYWAQTFRQRASHSPYTPKTTRPSAATSIRNSPNGWFRSVSSALSMPPDSDAYGVVRD